MRPAIESEPSPLEFYRTGVAPVQVMRQRSLPVIGEIKSPAGEVNRTRELWLIVSDRGLDEVQTEAAAQGWTMDLRAASQPARGSAGAAPMVMRLYRVTARTAGP